MASICIASCQVSITACWLPCGLRCEWLCWLRLLRHGPTGGGCVHIALTTRKNIQRNTLLFGVSAGVISITHSYRNMFLVQMLPEGETAGFKDPPEMPPMAKPPTVTHAPIANPNMLEDLVVLDTATESTT